MATQNEIYQKMLLDKMRLLDYQMAEVMGHVTSVRASVDKAKESTQKFLKISVESKKFMRKFQEVNNAVDTAVTSLIRISNALNDATNDDSSSESESGAESAKLPSNTSPPLRKKAATKNEKSSKPRDSTGVVEKVPVKAVAGKSTIQRPASKSEETTTPTKVSPKTPSPDVSSGQCTDSASSPETGKSPHDGSRGKEGKVQAMSVNVTVGSSGRRVSLSPSTSPQGQDSSDGQSEKTDKDGPLSPSVEAFLAAAAEANANRPITEQSQRSVAKTNVPANTGSNESPVSRGTTSLKEELGDHLERDISRHKRLSANEMGNVQERRPNTDPTENTPRLQEDQSGGSGDKSLQRRQNLKEIVKHSPPRARTKSNNQGPLRGPGQSPLHINVPRPQPSSPGPMMPPSDPRGIPQSHGHVYHQQRPPVSGHPGGVPSYHPSMPSPTFSLSSSGSGVPPSPGVPRSPFLHPQPGDVLEVQITHIVNPSLFWVQEINGYVQQFVNSVGQFYCQANIPIPFPKPGLLCCAKFSQDQCWYRAQVLNVHPLTPSSTTTTIPADVKVDVNFIDYGNSETVSSRNIRSLYKQFSQVPPLAMRCGLAQVAGTGKGGSWTLEMIAYFNSICLSRAAYAEVLQLQENGLPLVKLSITEKVQLEEGVTREVVKDIAEVLLSKGLARYLPLTAPPRQVSVAPPEVTRIPTQSQEESHPQMSSPPKISSPALENGFHVPEDNNNTRPNPEGQSSSKEVTPESAEKRSEVTAEPTDQLRSKGRPRWKRSERGRSVSSASTQSKEQATDEPSKDHEGESSSKEAKKEMRLRQELPITDGRLLMALSYIVNPNEFYVHLITPEAIVIDKLFEKLQAHYENKENLVKQERVKDLNVGDFCCAKFEKQPGWYRGKIVEIRGVGPKGRRKWDFRVFYVDYGNTEWVLETDVQPLDPAFHEPPAQVVKCSLAHITPKLPADKAKKTKGLKWTDQAIKTFTKLTGYEAKLYGYVKNVPADESMPVEVNLSISTPQMEVYLNQELVNLDLASSDILKKETGEDDDLEVSSTKWLESYSGGGNDDSDTGLPDSPNSLMDVLEKLDPMAIHFNAEINTYGFDRDDPEMATMGYKSNQNVCYYHVSGKGCHRGDSCKFEHPDMEYQAPPEEKRLVDPPRRRAGRKMPKCIRHHAVHQWLGIPCPKPKDPVIPQRPVETILNGIRETTLCYCTNNVVELLPEGSVVCVVVTAIHSPIHFWVQFVFGPRALDELKIECSRSLERPWEEGETLESLNENINKTCGNNKSKSHDLTIPALGEIVLARYSKDKSWYRARVTCVDEEKIEVFHVDYGSSAWVSEGDIQPALPQFLHLPFQAVQCRLEGLVESQTCEEEKGNARSYFEGVATGAPMVAYVTERNIDNLLYIDLYNTTSEDEDIWINRKLVEKGFYRPNPPSSDEKQEKTS